VVAQRHDYAAAVATATLRLVTLRDNDPWHQARREAQVPPPGDWRWWVIMAGRGFGKTRTGAEFIREEITHKRMRRVALVGATAADVRDVMIEGESGLIAVCRRHGLDAHYEPSKRKVTFSNGAVAKTYSAEEPDRLRGPQHDGAWADEVAAWEDGKDTWDQLQFGLRLGDNPRGIATTTPRPVPVVKDLMAQRTIYYDDDGVEHETDDPTKATVVVTSGSTYENLKNLPPAFASQIIRRYEGTRIGRQEIEGELLLDVPGALWTYDMIEADRVTQGPDDLDWQRIVIGVDPAAMNTEESSETGIVVAGVGIDGHGYVVEDLTLRGSPLEWAHAVVKAYDRWRADRVIAEINNGGLMVEQTLRTVRPNLPITLVRASRGKITRAEPVAALYEQHKVHHVGGFVQLEDQMTSYDGTGVSPDRMDALTWAITDLMLDQPPGEIDPFLRAAFDLPR
jgi:phage terminase large subunit-like protein